MSQLTRPITKDEIAAYNHAGVVLLRGILSLQAVNSLRRSIDEAVRSIPQSPSGYDLSFMTRAAEANDQSGLQGISGGQYNIAAIVDYVKSSGKPLLLDNNNNPKGSFFLDTGIAARLREFRQFSVNGSAPEIAASLLSSDKINFFGDQVFVKEPGTRERTAFHQDATYFEIEGEKSACCGSRSTRLLLKAALCSIFADHIGTANCTSRTFS